MDKVAIFGGTFNPIHLGHVACIKHLVENMEFEKIFLVPTGQNPLKGSTDTIGGQERLSMIDLAVNDFNEFVEIDQNEIHNPTPSYTADTLKKYLENYENSQLYLVMGLDAFQEIDQWKDFEFILQSVNILVVSRPPLHRPFDKDDFPQGVQPFIYSYEKGYCLLKSHRSIEFLKIATEEISSSEIRKKLKTGKRVSSFLSLEVEKYIVENEIYPRLEPGRIDFLELAHVCGEELNLRAMNVSGYDLRGLDMPTDFTLIASVASTKQAQSLGNRLRDLVKENYGLSYFSYEGHEEGRWVMLDYGGLIVHIFYDFVRHEYHLEQLWQEGKRLELKNISK